MVTRRALSSRIERGAVSGAAALATPSPGIFSLAGVPALALPLAGLADPCCPKREPALCDSIHIVSTATPSIAANHARAARGDVPAVVTGSAVPLMLRRATPDGRGVMGNPFAKEDRDEPIVS